MNSRRGAMMVVLAPAVAALLLLTLLVMDVGRALFYSRQCQNVADADLLSALRVRAEGLETIAGRWDAFGKIFSRADAGGAHLSSTSWSTAETETDKLKRALPGYKGRITAVRSVVAEANSVNKEDLTVTEAAALDLGITPRDQWAEDEHGVRKIIKSLWYMRNWGSPGASAPADDRASLEVTHTVPVFGGAWTIRRASSAELVWEVSADDPDIRARGNGGYPQSWTEALDGAALLPHRFAVYAASLVHE